MEEYENDIILSLRNITKIYPGVIALSDVSIDFKRGEIHAIVGENGAGKSTLIKTITGAVSFDDGIITIDGATFDSISPIQAREHGVEAIYQEYNLVEALSAAENICYGKKYGRFVNYPVMRKVAQDLFDQFKIDIDPDAIVRELSSAKMQIIEIAKAVSKGAKILIMDEPSAPLTVNEIDLMMNIVRKLKSDGVTILYISHRLDEIFKLADQVSVFRDGKYIATKNVANTNRSELIKLMVGRELAEEYPKRTMESGEIALELKNLSGNGVEGISLKAHRGEIVGLAGLVGAGRSEIMRVVYGYEKKQSGQVLVYGKEVEINNCHDAMMHGIGLVTEDRKREGCFLMMDVRWNIIFAALRQISNRLVVDVKKEKEITTSFKGKLKIRTPNMEQLVMNLSGGNQQKIIVARVLAAGLDILIFDEPTRGIDVGAKKEIYELMNELCMEGKTIIMISSDMEELLGMSDRIVVLYEKQYVGEIEKEDFSQERVLSMASGMLPTRDLGRREL